MRCLQISIISMLALHRAAAQQYVITPPIVTFTAPADSYDRPLPSQTVSITSPAGSIPFSLAVTVRTGGYDFIRVTVTGGTTPATLVVGAQLPSDVGPGYYAQNFYVFPPDHPELRVEGGASLAVTLPPPPSIKEVINDASRVQGPIAPGEIITIRGTDLGVRDYHYDPVHPENNSMVVTFDGIAGSLITASVVEIRAVVPYDLAGRAVTHMMITHYGVKSDALELPVQSTAPALYSADGSGTGLGAIVNHDGSVNDPDHPAPGGSVIYVVATGQGALTMPVLPGTIFTRPLHLPPVAPVSVTIAGLPAQIENLDQLAGQDVDLLLVAAVLPSNVCPGAQPVVLRIGDYSNREQGITVMVEDSSDACDPGTSDQAHP